MPYKIGIMNRAFARDASRLLNGLAIGERHGKSIGFQ
jgi:hypothetical protein